MATNSKVIPTVDQFGDSFKGGFWLSAGDDKKRSKKEGDEYDWKNSVTPKQIETLNDEGWGAFFTVNEFSASPYDENELNVRPRQNRKKEGIEYCRAVFIEDDSKQGLRTFPLEPSFIVESSSDKYHYYWMTHTAEFNEWELVMQTMVDEHGCDPNARDLSRVLRIPGMYHNKNEPFKVRIVGGNQKSYEWKAIKVAFPPAKTKKSNHAKDDSGKFDLATALKELTTAKNLHGSMISIALRFVNDGSAKTTFIDVMGVAHELLDHVDVDRKRRREISDRFTDEHLNEAWDSAVEKKASEQDNTVVRYEVGFEKFTNADYPPGFMGEVAHECRAQMEFPNKQIAIVCAHIICAAFSGRKSSFMDLDIGANYDLHAITGAGKDMVRKLLTRLIDQLERYSVPRPRGLSKFDSKGKSFGLKSLINSLYDHLSLVIIASEGGVSSSSTAGDAASVRAYVMQNQSSEPYTRTQMPEYSIPLPESYGVPITTMYESTKESTNFNSSQYGSGEAGRNRPFHISHKVDGEQSSKKFSNTILDKIMLMYEEAIRSEDFKYEKKVYGNKYFGACLKYVTNRVKFEAEEYVVKKIKQMRSNESDRRNKAPADVVADRNWASHSRMEFRVIKECLLLAIADASGNGKKKIVTKKHFDYSVSYFKELDRADRLNESDFEVEETKLVEAIFKYCIDHLSKSGGSKVFKKERIILRKDLTRGSNLAFNKIANDIANRKGVSKSDVMTKAYVNGGREGYWEHYGPSTSNGRLSRVGNAECIVVNKVSKQTVKKK